MKHVHEGNSYLENPRELEGDAGVISYTEGCDRESCGATRRVFRWKDPARALEPDPYPPGPWVPGACVWKHAGEPGGWDVWVARNRRLARQIEGRARGGLGIAYTVVIRVWRLVLARRRIF